MLLSTILKRFVRLGPKMDQSSSATGDTPEQRDDSSMAEFVRILGNYEGKTGLLQAEAASAETIAAPRAGTYEQSASR
jgi:hypothetical protein